MNNLAIILDRHHEHRKESAETMLEELKNSSKNYGVLKKKLEIFKREIMFRGDHESIFIEIDKMLEKEMNDLPLTNRSK